MIAKEFPAVILAAGEGRRLRGVRPKPLTKLLGLTLLERALLTCKEAGIKKFYVVVGYKKREVIKHVKELEKKYRMDIKIIENAEWKKGNGTSVLSAALHLKTPFFLLMCDHVFDVDIVKRFVESVDSSKYCLIGIDKKMKRIIDLEEATKVKTDGEFIADIGKNLEDFDAVDTGIFFFHPYVKEAIEDAMKIGDASLIGGVKILAKKKKIKGVEIEGKYWIDVDTQQNLKVAEKIILSSLIKAEDGFISHYINRKLSLRISKRLCNFNLTPNIITIISFFLSIVAAYLFLNTSYIYILLAGIITQASSIIDGCDGEIARLKFQSTSFGAWLDTILDRYADVAIATAITYEYWLIHRKIIAWIIGVLAVAGFILSSYAKKEYIIRYKKKITPYFMDNLGKRDFRLFGIFLGAIFGYPFEAMAILAIMHHASIFCNFWLRR